MRPRPELSRIDGASERELVSHNSRIAIVLHTQQQFMLRRNPTKIELRQEDKEEVSECQSGLQRNCLQGLLLSCGTHHSDSECSCSLKPSSSTRLSRRPLAPGRGEGPAGYLSTAPFSSSRRQVLLCFNCHPSSSQQSCKSGIG